MKCSQVLAIASRLEAIAIRLEAMGGGSFQKELPNPGPEVLSHWGGMFSLAMTCGPCCDSSGEVYFKRNRDCSSCPVSIAQFFLKVRLPVTPKVPNAFHEKQLFSKRAGKGWE